MSSHDDNRVLSRRGARILNENETRRVNGGAVDTETVCSYVPGYGVDGDVYTGDCIAS